MLGLANGKGLLRELRPMVGITSSEKSSLMSKDLRQVRCWFPMDNTWNLSKMELMRTQIGGLRKEKGGFHQSSPRCLHFGENMGTNTCWELFSMRSICLGIGQLRSITLNPEPSANGEQKRQENTPDFLQKMSTTQWEAYSRRIIQIGNINKLEMWTWNIGCHQTQLTCSKQLNSMTWWEMYGNTP